MWSPEDDEDERPNNISPVPLDEVPYPLRVVGYVVCFAIVAIIVAIAVRIVRWIIGF